MAPGDGGAYYHKVQYLLADRKGLKRSEVVPNLSPR